MINKYHIAGYEKPAAYNKLGLFDLIGSYDEKWNQLLRQSIALVTMKAHDTVQF